MPEIERKRKREKHPEEDEKKVQSEQEALEVEEETAKGEVEEKVEEKRGIKKKEEEWKPRTELGKKVASGEITDIDMILDSPSKILEHQIVDKLLPNIECILLNVGQAKGKFGGGKRNIWRQTQKKTKEGNRIKFAALAVAGTKEGYLGIGFAKSKETVPAREKAMRKAKLNIIKVPKGCGSWDCGCGEEHSIPFKTESKCSSVKIRLTPAPKGAGLLTEKEVRKVLDLIGIKDVYSKTFGQTKTKLNLIKACFGALKKLSKFKVVNKK